MEDHKKSGYALAPFRPQGAGPAPCHGTRSKREMVRQEQPGQTTPDQKQQDRPTYPIAEAILKIGRYIAITINPITIPRNTIIAGSSNAVSEATA